MNCALKGGLKRLGLFLRLNIFDTQLPEVLELRVREAQKAEKTVYELTDEIL